MKIAILGAGGWGTAIGILLSSKGHDVYMWTKDQEIADTLTTTRRNDEFLPGPTLNDNMYFSPDMAFCMEDAELLVTATPSHIIRFVAKKIKENIKPGQIVLNVSKGFEPETYKTLSEVLKEELTGNEIAVMSGPSHAEEVARFMPTTNVVSADNMETAKKIQEIFMSPTFRVYTNTDMLGVELGGALKNVIALGAGISAGLGLGDNALAALMTRGIAEISRLGVKMGAKAETFSGLSGIGDLIVTCMSQHSRNRRAGVLIGQGKKLDEALEEVHTIVEGVTTCKSAYALAQKYGVNMPITECTYEVLFGDMPVRESIAELMGRAMKPEAESYMLGN